MEVVVKYEIGERYGHGDVESLDEVKAADRQEQDLARLKDAIEDLRLLERGLRRGGQVASVDLGEAMEKIVHQGKIPRRRDLDALAADHLGHEIVGEVVVERRDRAGRAHPEEAAGLVRRRYSGICTISSHNSARAFRLWESLLAVR